MKILYLSPKGVKKEFYAGDNKVKEFDLGSISNSIAQGISQELDDVEITVIKDIVDETAYVSVETLNNFDLFLCDLSTSNANITYYAGLAEGIGKPVIYFIYNESTIAQCFIRKNILIYSDASLDEDFQKELNGLIKLAGKDPLSFSNKSKKASAKKKAFISYSHHDKAYLDRLMVHLKPLVKKGLIDIWVDTKIKTGDQWQKEIENALAVSSISILLISADFMASDFIIDNELPPLLAKAEVKGTKILPVILSPCRFSREPTLNRFQAANPPNEPLSSMGDDKREVIYDQLAHDIEQSLENA